MNKKSFPYLSVGIDIGADFSFMAIALPSQALIGKPYRIFHNSQRSLDGAVERIKALSEQYQLPAYIFMESTGIYHFPMYYRLKETGFSSSIHWSPTKRKISMYATFTMTNLTPRKSLCWDCARI